MPALCSDVSHSFFFFCFVTNFFLDLIRIIPFKPNVLINVVAFSVPTAQAAGIFLGTAIPQFLAGAGGILAGMWTGVQVLHFQ